MYTEDEAKTKWCPFARDWVVDGKDAAAINRHFRLDGTHVHSPCIASACMAWRWGPEIRGVSDDPDRPHAVSRFEKVEPRTGYCGLAGKPK